MDESFSTHYQIRHLNSVIATSYLKGGGISEIQGGISEVRVRLYFNFLSCSS